MCIIQHTKVRCVDLAENGQAVQEDVESQSPLPLLGSMVLFRPKGKQQVGRPLSQNPLGKLSSTQSLL